MKLPVVARKDVILVICDRLFKMMYFMATTEETSVKEPVRLFRDNIWKLYGLLESIVLDRGPQFVAELTKNLNRILEIETKLLTLFYSQTNSQIERMNQELEQYLKFFIDHRQKNQPEWLVLAEFAVNNKIHLAMKVSLFMANYSRKLRIEADIRRREKIEKITKFLERMEKVQKKAETALRKA